MREQAEAARIRTLLGRLASVLVSGITGVLGVVADIARVVYARGAGLLP